MSDKGKSLPCYGCAHSAVATNEPSGERPCGFCTRNEKRADPPKPDTWYDGSAPVRIPMDCYHSLDMKKQFDLWNES